MERVPLYRDEAVVLRVQKLGEADRIITLLTRSHGRVRAVGKGVRRTTSKHGARLEPASHVDLQMHTRLADSRAVPLHGRPLELVTQSESLHPYGAWLARDYSRWTMAATLLETTERLTEEGEPALRLYLLLLGALRVLTEGEHAPGLVMDAFFIRAMAWAGWQPALTECAVCSAPGPHAGFHVAAGGTVCAVCRPPGAARPAPAALALMVALLAGDWANADDSLPGPRREASGLIAAHLHWHLERGLRSLEYVDRTVGHASETHSGLLVPAEDAAEIGSLR